MGGGGGEKERETERVQSTGIDVNWALILII